MPRREDTKRKVRNLLAKNYGGYVRNEPVALDGALTFHKGNRGDGCHGPAYDLEDDGQGRIRLYDAEAGYRIDVDTGEIE